MARVNQVQFGIPMDDRDNAQEYLDDLHGDDRDEVIGDILGEYPFSITVDGEVWHSVDKTSADKVVLVLSFEQPQIISGDTLENLADDEERVVAAQMIASDNVWTARLDDIH